MDDARTLSPPTIVAGAFDAFGNARAAVEDLLTSGFAPDGVRITSNPANPDGVPGSFFAEIVSLPGICRRFVASLAGERLRCDVDPVRRGGVVVSVPVTADGERVLARNILQLHRGFDVEYAAAGAPLYGSRPAAPAACGRTFERRPVSLRTNPGGALDLRQRPARRSD